MSVLSWQRPWKLWAAILGMADGNFAFTSMNADQDILAATAGYGNATATGRIYTPKLLFTNDIEVICRTKDGIDDGGHWECINGVYRSQNGADAVIVVEDAENSQNDHIRIGMRSGDCQTILLHDVNVLAVLHGGFRCLIPERTTDPSIIDLVLNTGYFDRSTTRVWVGAGIGPCCWHAERYPEVQMRDPRVQPFMSVATRWVTGQPSVDLFALARAQLLQAGISVNHMMWDTRCTCCDQKDGKYTYWSHTRAKDDNTEDGRNLMLAWIDQARDV